MKAADAESLISGGVARAGGVWADLGAGSGTFTRALAALLGTGGVIYAVDRGGSTLSPSAPVASGLGSPSGEASGSAEVVPLLGDFRESLPLADLDGLVMANSLHFIATDEQQAVVDRVSSYLRSGGVFVLVEYDQRRGSPWVPYPVPRQRFEQLAQAAGLAAAREIGRRRSRFGPKDIYASLALKPVSREGSAAEI